MFEQIRFTELEWDLEHDQMEVGEVFDIDLWTLLDHVPSHKRKVLIFWTSEVIGGTHLTIEQYCDLLEDKGVFDQSFSRFLFEDWLYNAQAVFKAEKKYRERKKSFLFEDWLYNPQTVSKAEKKYRERKKRKQVLKNCWWCCTTRSGNADL